MEQKKKRVTKAPNPSFEPNWKTSATAENASLASVSLEEKHNPERLIEATYALSTSPMFVLLCRDFAGYAAAVGKAAQPGRPSRSEEQREFEVRLFAARMFLAGLRARRSR